VSGEDEMEGFNACRRYIEMLVSLEVKKYAEKKTLERYVFSDQIRGALGMALEVFQYKSPEYREVTKWRDCHNRNEFGGWIPRMEEAA
jgi:hypothetical protein